MLAMTALSLCERLVWALDALEQCPRYQKPLAEYTLDKLLDFIPSGHIADSNYKQTQELSLIRQQAPEKCWPICTSIS